MISRTLESVATVEVARHTVHPQFRLIHDAAQARQAPPPLPSSSQCNTCIVRRSCLAGAVPCGQRDYLDRMVHTWRRIAKGAILVRAGDPLHALYAIRSGSFKTIMSLLHGTSRVTGFPMAGETLGLDGIASGHHTCDVIALEESTVCSMPFRCTEALCRDIGPLQHRLHQLLAEEIVRQSALMVLAGLTADARVAAFLLNLSKRMQDRGCSPSNFTLRMTRKEIGSYLGVKLETVCRALSRFQREGWITVSGRSIELTDKTALARLY